jgi:hypothetical protein
MFKDICPYGLGGSTLLTDMGFFYEMQNTGQILRSRKNGKTKYTAINNDILQSGILTAQEKSILVHLLSLPEDWVVYKGLIWKEMNMGREQFNRNWKGLVEKGYVVSIRMIDKETNLVKGWNHIVYEEPVLPEARTDQSSDLLDFGQSEDPYLNKVITEQSNNETNEVLIQSNNPTKGEAILDSIFEEVWTFYGNSASRQVGSKKDARAKFMRLKSSEIELIRVHLPKFVKNHLEAKKADFLPNLTTYLNQRRFQDEKLPYATNQAKGDDFLNKFV